LLICDGSTDVRSGFVSHDPVRSDAIADLIQVVYASQPFGYDIAALSSILRDARRLNEQDDVTGALVCRHDIYLQLLEGPAEKVEATFARISRDDRHAGIKELVRRPVSERIFGDWAMLHDPATSWIWTREEIADGILNRVTPADVVAMFEAVALKAKDGLPE